jgi:hypothetical protein
MIKVETCSLIVETQDIRFSSKSSCFGPCDLIGNSKFTAGRGSCDGLMCHEGLSLGHQTPVYQKIAAGFKEKLLTAFGATLNEGRERIAFKHIANADETGCKGS